mmetsp:Transcript_14181/g.16147  ORF Transcript_14181/g.16147 Transcript_14181/m.16147 type:complete len:488 (+) Transcript_14181:1017-2480(+)
MAQIGYCATSGAVRGACPNECDADCGWTEPYIRKSFTTTSCSESEIQQLEDQEIVKERLCANILYCMEKRTPQCDESVREWFGGDSDDQAQWETLRQGYIKICSADNYEYNCQPDSVCSGDFVYNGVTYTQLTMPTSVRDAYLSCRLEGGPGDCSGGSSSYTVAWVYSSTASPRVMNLCQVGFWLGDVEQSSTFRGRVATIVHELSHFRDVADTDDMEYDRFEHLAVAQTSPWYYLDNAATWDNLFENTDHGEHTWQSFAIGFGEDDSTNGNSALVLTGIGAICVISLLLFLVYKKRKSNERGGQFVNRTEKVQNQNDSASWMTTVNTWKDSAVKGMYKFSDSLGSGSSQDGKKSNSLVPPTAYRENSRPPTKSWGQPRETTEKRSQNKTSNTSRSSKAMTGAKPSTRNATKKEAAESPFGFWKNRDSKGNTGTTSKPSGKTKPSQKQSNNRNKSGQKQAKVLKNRQWPPPKDGRKAKKSMAGYELW